LADVEDDHDARMPNSLNLVRFWGYCE